MCNHEPKGDLFDSIRKFMAVADFLKEVAAAPTTWREKYELVFSDPVQETLRSTGFKVDYYDPKRGYEEDVRAFIDAVVSKADNLRYLL